MCEGLGSGDWRVLRCTVRLCDLRCCEGVVRVS